MDQYLEKQTVERLKAGELDLFILLFDSTFDDLYSYVLRRLGGDIGLTEKIVEEVFLESLAGVQNIPQDLSFKVWLFALAKVKVWNQLSIAFSQGKDVSAISVDQASLQPIDQEYISRAEKVFAKLSLEEREIVRLKYFEQVMDSEVVAIIGGDEMSIGPKIYRVLKRVNLLLFGESTEVQGVYFTQLNGFMARVKELEKIAVPAAFKLNLRMNVSSRIEKKDFAINSTAEVVPEVTAQKEEGGQGSNDPAKIFVQAVKEMREDERLEKDREREELEKKERVLDFFERWRTVFVLLTVLLVFFVLGFFVMSFFDISSWWKGLKNNTCKVNIEFVGDFAFEERKSVRDGLQNKICEYYDVKSMTITRIDDVVVKIDIGIPDWDLEFKFFERSDKWRIRKYVRTFVGYEQSGENSGS